MDELELELAELRADRKRLLDLGFNTFSHSYYISRLENQVAAIKKAQAVLPEISAKLRAWRGERGIRVIVALLNDDGIEISANEVA